MPLGNRQTVLSTSAAWRMCDSPAVPWQGYCIHGTARPARVLLQVLLVEAEQELIIVD